MKEDIFEFATRYPHHWLLKLGMNEHSAKVISDYSGFLIIIIASVIIFYIAKYVILKWAHRFAKKSKTNWDDILLERKVLIRMIYIIPAIIIHSATPYIIPDYPLTSYIVQIVLKLYIYTVGLIVVLSLLDSIYDIYNEYDISKNRPIKGFMQVIKIILVCLYIIVLITILFVRRQDFGWLAGFGAFSAVLILVFKDPILGFVGGIQLATNDMLRIGDWIEMSKFGADGTVTEITITTVKVQNWDKTITTIPTYSLISDSYKNWRGMEESGGRRIKRSVMIDMNSIRFCTPEMLENFGKFEHVSEYVKKTEAELQKYNQENKIDNSMLVNGHRQTNIGVFRAYLKGYLHSNPNINQDMTFLVRQLQVTDKGLPIEIYVFSKVQEWGEYENIQSDIFDHVLAVVPQFGLRVYQSPSGADFKSLINP